MLSAYLYMRTTNVSAGSDFVVLTMSIGVAIAFTIAVINRFARLKLLSAMAEQVIFVMVPPLALIFLVLGTIFIGVATPTEGGAMGAVGAMLLAIAKGRLTLDLTRQAAQSTAKLSAFVIFILIGARVFSLTFYGVDGHRWVEEMLVGLPGGQMGFLIVVNVFVFLLAFFLDFFEIAFIVIPLLAPAADQARHRPDLVRRDPCGQHADVVHASAVRFRAVLSAIGGAPEPLYRPRHRQDHAAGHDRRDLLGRGTVRVHPVHHGRRW